MSYMLIQPPMDLLTFHEKTKPELKRYYEWFMGEIPGRIRVLETFVREDPFYSNWSADYSRESLIGLGEWFVGQIGIRSAGRDEVETIRKSLKFPVDIPDWDLDPKTISLCFDIGMYLGEVILRNKESAHWGVYLARKRDVNYGQPAVIGLAAGDINVVRVVRVTARNNVTNSSGPTKLVVIYDRWVNFVLEAM